MDELKNCPFCGHTKFIFRYEKKYGYIVSCIYCGGSISSHISREDAIKRWNTRSESEAMVLTLEELQERIGKPVYTVPIGKGYAFWSIVDGWDISKDGSWWSDYGETFLCYDKEPKGERA